MTARGAFAQSYVFMARTFDALAHLELIAAELAPDPWRSD
jgi:hypothetical protein